MRCLIGGDSVRLRFVSGVWRLLNVLFTRLPLLTPSPVGVCQACIYTKPPAPVYAVNDLHALVSVRTLLCFSRAEVAQTAKPFCKVVVYVHSILALSKRVALAGSNYLEHLPLFFFEHICGSYIRVQYAKLFTNNLWHYAAKS